MYVCKTAKNGNFYPRSPCGERPCPRCSRGTLPKDFYPRSPCGERRKYMRCVLPVLISIHALLAESDATWYTSAPWMAFLSTLSLRRATRPGTHQRLGWHFYPRSPCGERRGNPARRPTGRRHFYPRSPCGERPHMQIGIMWGSILFLSTLSLRRATVYLARVFAAANYFYPRSPCGERRHLSGNERHRISISIHALLAESDITCCPHMRHVVFLSTLSLRRATILGGCVVGSWPHFYPRSPCGERPRCMNINPPSLIISIHALLAESDYRYRH